MWLLIFCINGLWILNCIGGWDIFFLLKLRFLVLLGLKLIVYMLDYLYILLRLEISEFVIVCVLLLIIIYIEVLLVKRWRLFDIL